MRPWVPGQPGRWRLVPRRLAKGGHGVAVGERASKLPGCEAVQRAAEGPLRARRTRWVLQQEVVLCRPQLCRVVILHLLLQRAGCRRGQGGARVYDVWRRRRYRDASSHARPHARAPELGRCRCGRKRREDQQQSWKQRAFHRLSPFGTSALNQPPSSGVFNIHSVSVNLGQPRQRAHLPRVKSPLRDAHYRVRGQAHNATMALHSGGEGVNY